MIEKLLNSEVQKFIKDHQDDDPFLLSLIMKPDGDFPLKDAIEQIHSRKKAKAKLPSWHASKDIVWPTPLSVEQSSSELTANFKASLVKGNSIADLTGGMGVDTRQFADHFDKVHYVEPSQDLCEIANHNFKIFGKNIRISESTAEDFLHDNQEVFDAIYLDPSRRAEGRKVYRIDDCIPNLYEIVPECLKVTKQLLVKLSPMVDLSIIVRDFKPGSIWIVAVKGQVREVLFLIDEDKKPTKIHAVVLSYQEEVLMFEFDVDEETQAQSQYSLPMQYIYEPNAAILKAGAFKLFGARYQLNKLHQHSHLYTSDELVSNFPGKMLKVIHFVGQNKKDVLKSVPTKKVNVITRNFPMSAAQLKKKFGLKDGGDQFLIGTTLMDGSKALLLCDRLG